MNIESQINLYNTAKLKRDRLIDDSSDSNPVVEELNNSLRAMKQNIIRAVDNLIVSLNVKRDDAESRERRAQSRVASIPTKERRTANAFYRASAENQGITLSFLVKPPGRECAFPGYGRQ